MRVANYLTCLIVSVGLLGLGGCKQDEQRLQALEREKAALADEKATLMEEKASLTEANSLLEQDKEKLSGELAAAKGSMEDALERATNAEGALAELKVAHDKALAEAGQVPEQTQAEIAALKRQVAELTQKLQETMKALALAKKAQEAAAEAPPPPPPPEPEP